ncbi:MULTISPECIES: response regulator [unclassified Meridianimarinicoccus]|uniref:response regulator n=1 Tax=unclassified Meridianimarinicoccus TaxID=2923344 RepID=UPI0018693E92|nr:response regulator [Fluviibacterium sp. MJW13]
MTPAPARLIPTSARPLLGLTVMVVEDSRFASEALRQMCLHGGARIRRADCIASARRHLAAYFPSVSIVDMGLPDGDGAELISEIRQRCGDLAPVIATSGDPDREMPARRAGAHDFLPKPVASLGLFEQVILRHLPDSARPKGPRILRRELPMPDRAALRDDLDHAERLCRGEPDTEMRTYLGAFVAGVARCAEDESLARAADDLPATAGSGALRQLRALLQDRLRKETRAPV